jgi:hypothetical protein
VNHLQDIFYGRDTLHALRSLPDPGSNPLDMGETMHPSKGKFHGVVWHCFEGKRQRNDVAYHAYIPLRKTGIARGATKTGVRSCRKTKRAL